MRKKKFNSVEDSSNRHSTIDKIAKKATKAAYSGAKASGVSVTYRKGNFIVSELPDGTIKKIAAHSHSPRKVKVGTRGKL